MTITKKTRMLAAEAIAVSEDGLIKVLGLTKPIGNKVPFTLKGVNVGFGDGHGIDGAFIESEMGSLFWTSSKGSGFAAKEVTMTLDEGYGLPPPGEYDIELHLNYIRSPDDIEEIVIPNWKLKIEE